MKTASDSIRAMKRMNTVPEEMLKKAMRQQEMEVDGHMEIEVDDDDTESSLPAGPVGPEESFMEIGRGKDLHGYYVMHGKAWRMPVWEYSMMS